MIERAAIALGALLALVACSAGADDDCRRGRTRCEDERCAGPNPTDSSRGVYCVSGSGARCCGDVGLALYCSDEGAWVCPDGAVLASQCESNCLTRDGG